MYYIMYQQNVRYNLLSLKITIRLTYIVFKLKFLKFYNI